MEGFLPVVGVVILGGVVQYFRAYKGFPEWAAWLVTGAVGVAVYWIGTDSGLAITSKGFWREAILWIMAARGGTSAASGLSHVAAIVPQTNSK